MAEIIQIGMISNGCDKTISVTKHGKINSDMLLPPVEVVDTELAVEHKSEPIKSIDDINRVSSFLINNGRYRDNMLFIVGINFGLRVSDLTQLRFTHIINDDLTFKTTFPVLEIKTKNTRKKKQNRYITINDAVMDAIILYLENHTATLSDYLFRSESNRGGSENKPLTRKSVDRILKGISDDLNLNIHMSTHTLRKTFAYHQMLIANNDHRKLLLLQKMFGHSSVSQTLDYIGITREEIEDAYKSLNLGLLSDNKLLDSTIGEFDNVRTS